PAPAGLSRAQQVCLWVASALAVLALGVVAALVVRGTPTRTVTVTDVRTHEHDVTLPAQTVTQTTVETMPSDEQLVRVDAQTQTRVHVALTAGDVPGTVRDLEQRLQHALEACETPLPASIKLAAQVAAGAGGRIALDRQLGHVEAHCADAV